MAGRTSQDGAAGGITLDAARKVAVDAGSSPASCPIPSMFPPRCPAVRRSSRARLRYRHRRLHAKHLIPWRHRWIRGCPRSTQVGGVLGQPRDHSFQGEARSCPGARAPTRLSTVDTGFCRQVISRPCRVAATAANPARPLLSRPAVGWGGVQFLRCMCASVRSSPRMRPSRSA